MRRDEDYEPKRATKGSGRILDKPERFFCPQKNLEHFMRCSDSCEPG